MPEPGATSELLSGIAARLARDNIEVSALAGQPSYFSAHRLPANLKQDGVFVRRVLSTQLNKNSIIGRILNSLTFSLSVLGALLIRRPANACCGGD